MIDYYNNFDNDPYESPQEPYPDYFYEWDELLTKNLSLRYMDAEELSEIIEIYLNEDEIKKAKQTIQYALKLYPGDEDLIYDILLLLNDYELWNDLLILAEQYRDMPDVWANGHKITALLHLGMEEDAFLFFRKMKNKYEKEKESLSLIYQAMGEALQEVDLFEASINVVEEAIAIMGPDVDFYWLQLQSFLSLEHKEKALNMAGKIEQINPLDGESWHRLGKIYLDLHETEKAIDAFEFAESLEYKNRDNLLNMIAAYEQNGNHLKALEKVKEYLYLYPENYMINILAANICSELELWEEALTYVDAALKVVPEMDSLYLYKSNFFLNLGEQKKAMLALEEGIKQTNDTEGDLKKELERLHNQYPNY
jgi:tetratricopeptide (TPR) repeat protein